MDNSMKKIRQLLIVLIVGLLLAGFVVLLYLLDPAFIPDAYRVTSMAIVVSWAFFILPSIFFDVQMAIKYFGARSPEKAFGDGVRIGVIFGFGGIVVASILVSPVTGILWYIQTVKEIVLSKKNNKQ